MGNESNKRGFDGLSGMKTNIDDILNHSEEPIQTEKQNEPTKNTQQSSTNEEKRTVYENPEEKPQVSWQPWFWFIFGGVVLYAIFSNSSGSANNSAPATEQVAPAAEEAAAPASEKAVPVAENASLQDGYQRPPVGSENILGVAQIKYCIKDGYELDAISQKLNNSSEATNSQIDRFNGMINEHNSRCGSYRYYGNNNSRAESEMLPLKITIQNEAVHEFFGETKKNHENKNNGISSNERSVTQEELDSIESACSKEKYLDGPAAYKQCKERQLNKLGNAPSRPDLSSLNTEELASIESACSSQKYLDGAAKYNICLNNQLAKLKKAPSAPDLSVLSYDEQTSIESACSTQKYLDGPAAYNKCLRRQMKKLGY